MQDQAQPSRQSLYDLSKDKLVSLLRSTYEYKPFVRYYDDHDLTFLDKYEESYPIGNRKTNCHSQKLLSQAQVINQLQTISKQNNLNLHSYHLELIFDKFKRYYDRYESHKTSKMKAEYDQKIRKAAKEGDSLLPQDLMEICLEKENSLTKQLMNKKKGNIKL